MLLLFIAAWALSIAVISSAATMGGDPNKIINGQCAAPSITLHVACDCGPGESDSWRR